MRFDKLIISLSMINDNINVDKAIFFKDTKLQQHLQDELNHITKYKPKLRREINKLYIQIEAEVLDLRNQKHSVIFMIVISKSYPLKAPQVYLLNDLVIPRMNDFRDLTENILESRWTYSNKIQDIVLKLEDFCNRMYKLNDKPLKLQRIGKFHPGQKILMEMIKGFSIQKFQVIDKDNNGQNKLLGIGDMHLTLWRINKSIVQLELAAPIQAVCQIHNSRTGEIILKIKNFKNLRQSTIISRKLVFENAAMQNQFTRILLKTITTLQTIKISFQNRRQKQNELVAKQIKNIQMREEEFAKNPTSKQAANILNRLYQQIIDYYSLRGDYLYLVYVHKMNNLVKYIKS